MEQNLSKITFNKSFLKLLKGWIQRHYLLLLVLLLGVGIRGVYLAELCNGPLQRMHEAKNSDMQFFEASAVEICSGDVLLNQELHPLHDWHRLVGEQALSRLHGTAWMGSAGEDEHTAEIRKLWDRWYGGKRFHQEPLYAYFIAMIYAVMGQQVLAVYVIQSLLGLCSIVLLYLIALEIFGKRAAGYSALLAVLFAPMLFFEGVLLRATLISFAGVGLVYLMLWALRGENFRKWALVGFACGAAMLLKTTFVLFLIGTLAVVVLHYRRAGRRWSSISLTGAVLAGVMVAIAPLIVRNVWVGVSPFSFSSVTSITLLAANCPGTNPGLFTLNLSLLAGEVGILDGSTTSSLVEILRMHSLLSFLQMMWAKVAMIFLWYEHPNNVNFYFYSIQSKVLGLLPVKSSLILTLVVPGLFLALQRRKPCLPLLILIATHLVTILMVYVSARFRMPLLVAAIPLGGFCLDQIHYHLQHGYFRTVIGVGICLVALALVINRPFLSGSRIRACDVWTVYEHYYAPAISAFCGAGDIESVAASYSRILDQEPAILGKLGVSRLPTTVVDADLLTLFSSLRARYSVALAALGFHDEAHAEALRSIQLKLIADEFSHSIAGRVLPSAP